MSESRLDTIERQLNALTRRLEILEGWEATAAPRRERAADDREPAPVVAAVGILGAVLGPVLVGADSSGLSIAFLAIALAAAVGVLVWQRWNWLALGAFAVSAPQLIAWTTTNYSERLGLTLFVLAG